MTTTVTDITPAGNGLFQVTLADERGTSQHEVAVPDGFVEEVLGADAGDVALQDVVLAAVDWRIAYEDRWELEPSFSLDQLRGVGDFEEELAARARRWAASPSPHEEQREEPRAGSNARLVDETSREQETGQASSPMPTDRR